MKQNLSIFSKEDMAFIYQQIEEFKPFLTEQSTVLVEEINSKSSKDKVALKLKITEGDSVLTIKARGKSVVEAMMNCKTKALKVLNNITDEVVTSSQRQSEINEVLKNTKIH
jgi:hypothetical protein